MIIQPTIHGLATVLFKRKKMFIASACTVFALGGAYLALATPLYRSEASVVVRFDEHAIPETNMARDSSPEVTAANERREMVLANAEIMTSPDLAQAVIDYFGLSRLYPDIVANPPSRGTPLDEAVRVFQANLNVEPGQQGDVIEISFQHHDPATAQAVVQRLIADYMKREGQIFSSSDFTFQQQQMEQSKARLVADQVQLRDFKTKAGITSFDDQVAELIKQRRDVANTLQNAEVSLGQAHQRAEELRSLLASVSPVVQNTANGEKYHALDDAESRLVDLQTKQRQMMATYDAKSPLLDPVRAAIAAAQTDVQRSRSAVSGRDSTAPNLVYQNIQTDLLRATADNQAYSDSVAVLQGQVAAMDSTLQDLEASHTRLDQLSLAVQIDDDAYRALALHLEDARVVANRVRDRISHGAVIAEASLPYKPSRPRYLITAIGTVLAGILAAFGTIIFFELIDDRFTDVDQVEQQLGIPVLAVFGERS